MIKNFLVSPAPYLRVSDSASGMTRRSALALLPAFLVILIHQPAERLRISAVIFLTAFLIETGLCFLQKKKTNFKDGSTVLWSLLLIFIIPAGTEWGKLAAASGVMIFLGKDFYGGRAHVWVHPAWLGYAFLVLSFPKSLFSSAWQFSFWNPFSGLWPALITFALLSGGILLMVKKNSSWEVPLLYFGLLFIPCQLMGIHTTLSLPVTLLTGFWILSDMGTAPCSRRARIYSAVAAALLTLILDLLEVPAAPVFAVLLLNLLTPWMDEWMLPQGISFEAKTEKLGMRT